MRDSDLSEIAVDLRLLDPRLAITLVNVSVVSVGVILAAFRWMGH